MNETREIKGEYFIRALGGPVIIDVTKKPLPPMHEQKHLFHYYRVSEWEYFLSEKCEHNGIYDFTIHLENNKIYGVSIGLEMACTINVGIDKISSKHAKEILNMYRNRQILKQEKVDHDDYYDIVTTYMVKKGKSHTIEYEKISIRK
jgi:hypothetical protein